MTALVFFFFRSRSFLFYSTPMILLGHYFVAWLMLKETLFTLAYTDPLNYEYEEATATVLDEVSSENV